MKKFYIIHSEAFLKQFPDSKPVQLAYHKEHALATARHIFGADNVDDVEPVTNRVSDFIDLDVLDEYLITSNRVSPPVYLEICKDLKI